MAWRIEEQVVRGEIDNRTPGRVLGKIWLVGRDEAVDLDLQGNPWRDLAGHRLTFTNPDAKPGADSGFSAYQSGRVGDMTASRKVRVPDCTMDELMDEDEDDDPPQSLEEAQADAEDARMQLLLDRVTARLEREEPGSADFQQIYEEERSRLMRERGEKEPTLTPEVADDEEFGEF